MPAEYLDGKKVSAIEVDMSRVLRLSTTAEILAFTEEHATFTDPRRLRQVVNWTAVMERYGGIEIAPYNWELRLDQRTWWYYTWDVASGCIWDRSALRELQPRSSLLPSSDESSG